MAEAVLLLALLNRRRKRKQRQVRTMWVRPIFIQRSQQGEFHHLLQEMRLADRESHFCYLRMSKETFDFILAKVEPWLARSRHCSSHSVRTEISPAERRTITLRFLATGSSQVSLPFSFRVGRATVCKILQETCDAIWNVLQPEYVKAPSTKEEWKGISTQFQRLWNFPNCIGAIEEKHVLIQAPVNSGSTYFNYKGTHSIVLLAVCDAHYRFILVDVGDAGRHSDGSVLNNSAFGQALEANVLNIPSASPLPGTTHPALPYMFVGDEAFPLKFNMMRPYPGKNLPESKSIYNYRLSRARRIIENSFGILAARWRIFRRPIIADPNNVVLFTKARIVLHNYLRTTESNVYCPPGFIDGEDGSGNYIPGGWRAEDGEKGFENLGQVSGNRYTKSAADVRDAFRDYFSTSIGELSWQYNHVRRTN